MGSHTSFAKAQKSAKQAWFFVHGKQAKAWHIGHTLQTKHNFEIKLIFTGAADFKALKKQEQPDLLVVMGGPMGVYDKNKPEHNYLNHELDFIRDHLGSGRPMLGICLGAQLMAHTLGAEIYNGLENGIEAEMGWCGVQVNEEGLSTPIRHFDSSVTMVAQYHQDGMYLPMGAKLLASSERFPVQAFQYQNSYGLQFHADSNKAQMTLWEEAMNVYPYGQEGRMSQKKEELRQGTEMYLETLNSKTELFLEEMLVEMDLAL